MRSRTYLIASLFFAISLSSAAAQGEPETPETANTPDAAEVQRYVDGVKLSYKVLVLSPARAGRAASAPSQVDRLADHISFEKAIKAAANTEQRKLLIRFREKYRDCANAAAPSLSELDDTYVDRLERCGEGISDRAADVIAAGY